MALERRLPLLEVRNHDYGAHALNQPAAGLMGELDRQKWERSWRAMDKLNATLRRETAMQFAKEAQRICGDRREVYFSYADLSARAGDWQRAYQNARMACELAPWHLTVWELTGWIQTELEQLSPPERQNVKSKSSTPEEKRLGCRTTRTRRLWNSVRALYELLVANVPSPCF